MKNSLLSAILMILILPAGLIAGCNKELIPSTTAKVGTSFVFAEQPAGATAGAVFGIQPIVYVIDENGHINTGFNGSVALSITPGTGASGATLLGTNIIIAVGGVAYFTDLSIDEAGPGYSLSVLNSSLLPAISAIFNVSAAAPATTSTT